jgi:hypothetical protein
VHRYLLLAALLSLSACKKENPDYCDQSPTPSDCPAPDSPPGCTADEQCPGQVCDVPSRTCVQCTASSAAACTDATPVCDGDDHTCRPCTAHSECASNACLPDGSCAAEDQVAYVTTNGASTDCTHAAPCAQVADALATQRPYVKLTGTLTEAVTIDSQDVTLLADPGAKLTPMAQGSLLTLTGTSNVSVYDLDIDGAHATGTNPVVYILAGATGTVAFTRVHVDNGGADGILSSASGGALTVTQSTVSANTGGGIAASGGALTVTQSTVSANTGGGIAASGGGLTVTQSTVSANTGGGISVTSGATVHITNNFIVRNGGTSSPIGGLYLGSGTGSGSELAFNTIVDNEATTGAANSGGVVCLNVGFAGANNIIARNFINNHATASNSNSFGDCTYDIAPSSTVEALKFVEPDMTPYNYHLGSGSTAIDHAATASAIAVDFDEDARPQGAQKDQGADEYTP